MKRFLTVFSILVVLTVVFAVCFPVSSAKYVGKTDTYTMTVYSEYENRYRYTNGVQTFTVEVAGYYYIESWGGDGGRGGGYRAGLLGTGKKSGGFGGTAAKEAGLYYLEPGTLYIYVGSAGGSATQAGGGGSGGTAGGNGSSFGLGAAGGNSNLVAGGGIADYYCGAGGGGGAASFISTASNNIAASLIVSGGAGGGGGGSSFLKIYVYPLSAANDFPGYAAPVIPGRTPSNVSRTNANGYAWIQYLGARHPGDVQGTHEEKGIDSGYVNLN